jgi:phytoene dehydrogenase-like protein
MLTQQQRRKIVFNQLELVTVDYRVEMDHLPFAESSMGLICRYNSTGGGRSSKVTDTTASAALMDATESSATKNARAWRGLVSRVYASLLEAGTKSEYDRKHDQLLGWLLFERVLMGRKLSEISAKSVFISGRISAANLSRYFGEVLDLCVIEAVKLGLIP